MVIRNLFLSAFFFTACSSSPDSKGEDIPSKNAIALGQQADKNIAFLSTQLEDQASASLYYLRAKNYVSVHAFGLADKDIDLALRDNPGEPAYLALSSQIKLRVENYQKSIDQAKLIEFTEWNTPSITLVLSENYIASKQLSLARRYLQKLKGVRLNSAQRESFERAITYLNSDSMAVFRQMSTKPRDESPAVYGYYEQGLNQIPSFTYQQMLLTSLKNYPQDPYFLRYWARFLVKLKKYDQAALVYKQLLKVYPKTNSLQAELIYFDLAKRGLFPSKRIEVANDSLQAEKDSLN